jgi:hypothetical protein
MQAPIEHRFTLEGDAYCLKEWTRGQERRMRAGYALAISAGPQTLEEIDGIDLWAEAVARECLTEAPPLWWETLPAVAGDNGTPRRLITTEQIPRALWEAFRGEVNRFLEAIFPAPAALAASPAGPGPDLQGVVESPETVPAVFRGRAE